MLRDNLERLLADDPYNERRIFILTCVHDAIYYLRHGPHRRNDVIATLEDNAAEMAIAISSAVVERDPQFERLCRNLELMLPVSIRILSKHNDRETDKDVADDLISCIPSILQQPMKWEPDAEDISDEDEFEEQNSRHHHHHR
ncbi:uncharacterized protein N7479_007204 [Penicillium vulpinum]|uniref:Uncharacterized protein n=1 Tax=Penicillium vulpinum TaxID=29845 RepID=A0A1V6S068_9EURO|nr:uncharacterized protein N7479_007204 [Penicillium vulpinum]KAJ5960054.1 hypothetical protein N7479_007204 [Penicillium vulpinum]OQE07405.1 hypothetical protein PENVUL_c013G04081 [Penicillium vulpinum]